MTYLKNLTVAGAAVAFTAFAPMAFAEDDLDELLNDVAAAPADASAAADGAAEAVAGELAEEAAPTEAPAEAVVLSVPVEQPVEAASGDDDAELIANIRANEVIRRQAYDEQAQREIRSARAAMSAEDYTASSRHYELALKLLNDSPATAGFRQECESGVAESLYRQALKDWGADRRDSAMELMQKAIQARHPKARKQLEIWKASLNDADRTVDVAEISHVRNEKDFKTKRESNRRHLKRARQLLAVRDIDGALEECEIVLVKDPYNEEAIRLRRQIVKKQQHVGSHEQEVAREGMISEVARKWRPVYAANVRDIDEVGSTTVRKTQDEDSERALEQSIKRRMKEMILPTISFKPPMTIIDAVEFFRGVSKDLDDPAKPIEKRGFNFVLKNQKPLRS